MNKYLSAILLSFVLAFTTLPLIAQKQFQFPAPNKTPVDTIRSIGRAVVLRPCLNLLLSRGGASLGKIAGVSDSSLSSKALQMLFTGYLVSGKGYSLGLGAGILSQRAKSDIKQVESFQVPIFMSFRILPGPAFLRADIGLLINGYTRELLLKPVRGNQYDVDQSLLRNHPFFRASFGVEVIANTFGAEIGYQYAPLGFASSIDSNPNLLMFSLTGNIR